MRNEARRAEERVSLKPLESREAFSDLLNVEPPPGKVTRDILRPWRCSSKTGRGGSASSTAASGSRRCARSGDIRCCHAGGALGLVGADAADADEKSNWKPPQATMRCRTKGLQKVREMRKKPPE